MIVGLEKSEYWIGSNKVQSTVSCRCKNQLERSVRCFILDGFEGDMQ